MLSLVACTCVHLCVQAVSGITFCWGASADAVTTLALPPLLPRVVVPLRSDGGARHGVWVTPGHRALCLPAAVVTRIALFLGCSRPDGAAAPPLLQGAVCWGWWAAWADAQRLWHEAVVGTRWHTLSRRFAAATPDDLHVVFNARLQTHVLTMHGLHTNGTLCDPQVAHWLLAPDEGAPDSIAHLAALYIHSGSVSAAHAGSASPIQLGLPTAADAHQATAKELLLLAHRASSNASSFCPSANPRAAGGAPSTFEQRLACLVAPDVAAAHARLTWAIMAVLGRTLALARLGPTFFTVEVRQIVACCCLVRLVPSVGILASFRPDAPHPSSV